jgi:hypothetical protein
MLSRKALRPTPASRSNARPYVITAGGTTDIHAVMQAGAVTETIQVTASPAKVAFQSRQHNVQAPDFGRVTSTMNDPRRMQFGLKLYW